MNRIKWALVLVFGLTLFLVPFASAHSFVDHCAPEIGSTVATAPKEIRCVFTEAIDAKQTVITVVDVSKNQVDNKDLISDPNDKDGKTVYISLNTAKVTNGLYTVTWSTVSEDGDSTDGQWQFAVGTQSVPSVAIVSPTADTMFDQAPADVTISIKVSNFDLGQGGKRWQVYIDDKLVLEVTDGKTSATLKAVEKGDHALKVALATDAKSLVATAGMPLMIGPEDQVMPTTVAAMPAATTVAPTPQSQSTAAGNTSSSNIPIALVIGIGLAVVVLVLVFVAVRRRTN